MQRVVLVGIEGFDPELAEKWIDDLPNMKKLREKGVWGRINSTNPPSPATAWISSRCGRNPGASGVWDESYREDFTYSEWKKVDSGVIDERVDCLYKILPGIAQRVALVDVPLTWPPVSIQGGFCISRPSRWGNREDYIRPETLKDEIKGVVEEYIPEMPEYGEDVDKLSDGARRIDAQRCELARYFLNEKHCDYVSVFLPGLYMLFSEIAEDKKTLGETVYLYYQWLDGKIGELSQNIESAVLMLFSAYSVRASSGTIHINEWLVSEGYLSLNEYPSRPVSMNELDIDWTRSRIWSFGKYGALYINLEGRESQGCVRQEEIEAVIDEVTDHLGGIQDGNGQNLPIKTVLKGEVQFGPYAEYGPDIFIDVGAINWGTTDMIGSGEITSTGSRSLSYGDQGYFCCFGPDIPAAGEIKGLSVLNIASTVMDIMGLDIPQEMEKPSLLRLVDRIKKRPSDKEKSIRSRLDMLGY
jgi:predicted AlkP superfamily phosphohydrolase/phosphomutase